MPELSEDHFPKHRSPASSLPLRVYAIAQAIHSAQPESTRPELVSSLLLKEQHVSTAEGCGWPFQREPEFMDEGRWVEGVFLVLDGRQAKYPERESLSDSRDSVGRVIKDLVVPII